MSEEISDLYQPLINADDKGYSENKAGRAPSRGFHSLGFQISLYLRQSAAK
jgi:hypothetical protein